MRHEVQDLKTKRTTSITIDLGQLYEWNVQYHNKLIENPIIEIEKIRNGLISLLMEGAKDREQIAEDFENVPVHLKNHARHINIREIRENYINKIIQFEGIVKNTTEVKPRVVVSAWKCKYCRTMMYIPQDLGELQKPTFCDRDGCKSKTFEFKPEKSVLKNAHRISVQERPEGLRGGENPSNLILEISDDLSGMVYAGMPVKFTGILRALPSLTNPKSIYLDYIVECLSFEISSKQYEDIVILPEEEEKIQELAEQPDIFLKLRNSIAPDIIGNEIIKDAVVYQLFGGVSKKTISGETRGNIHILLVTDPSCGKSQILRYIYTLAPRAVMATGGGTTKAGLTASAIKSEIDGKYTLEAGAMVLGDQGLVLIDEMDKMSKDDRSSMHEALEQGTVTISKAGINATLKARCSVIGAANPRFGRFDNYMSLGEQINMPPSLLSRFDLIFTMTDIPEEKRDFSISEHILSINEVYGRKSANISVTEDELKIVMPDIDPDLFRKYIAFAKMNYNPVLTKAAMKTIQDNYLDYRKRSGENENKAVSITPRQLEGLIRIAEASARIRLSNVVDETDALRAIGIMETCLKGIAFDESTGAIDTDKMYNKVSASGRKKKQAIAELIKEFCKDEYKHANQIIDELGIRGYDKTEIEITIENMHNEALLVKNNYKYKSV